MHFIQNPDLREWVKESLRKAIFQKAHALATQTGCEILVKLQDDSDTTTGHQYYATNGLQKAFRSNRLRMHPEEKCVSGETGMPMLDQSMQVYSSGEVIEGQDLRVKGQEFMVGNQAVLDSEFREQYLANGDAVTQTVQMHERMAQENAFIQSDGSSSGAGGETNSQIHHFSSTMSTHNDVNDKMPDICIKLEKMEDEDDEMESGSLCQTSHGERLSESSSTSALSRSTVSINPKPYQCAVCRKAFRSVQVLQKHTQTFHARLHGGAAGSSPRNRGRGGHRFNKKIQFTTLPMPPEPPDFKGFYCTMCQEDFPTAIMLHDHMTLSHMEALAKASLDLEKSSENDQPGSSSAKVSSKGSAGSSPSCTELQMLAASFLPQGSPQQSSAPSSLSVPLFMKLPVASAGNIAFTQSSPSGPVFSGLQVGSSRSPAGRSKNRTFTKRLMGKQLSNRDIMSAILQTAGPVATHFTVLTASPNFILGSTYITKEQFVAAASALEDLHLGSLVTVRHVHGRPSVNFVKKPPSDANEFLELEANTDLCSSSLYEEKYKAATPACVPQGTRDKLISLGLVTQDDFK